MVSQASNHFYLAELASLFVSSCCLGYSFWCQDNTRLINESGETLESTFRWINDLLVSHPRAAHTLLGQTFRRLLEMLWGWMLALWISWKPLFLHEPGLGTGKRFCNCERADTEVKTPVKREAGKEQALKTSTWEEGEKGWSADSAHGNDAKLDKTL